MGGTRAVARRGWTALLAGSLLLAACDASVGRTPEPSLCDGIPADMGGCSADRPVFSGTTCEELGREWGRWVDAHVRAVIDGPPEVGGKSRSVLIGDALVLASVGAGGRLDELDLLAACDVPAFLAAAREELSAELETGIGGALFDGDPIASAEDWQLVQERYIRIIDEGE